MSVNYWKKMEHNHDTVCIVILHENKLRLFQWNTFKFHQSLEVSQKRRGSGRREEVEPKETPFLPPPSLPPHPLPPFPPPPPPPPPAWTFRGGWSSRRWRWPRERRIQQDRGAPAGGCPSKTWRGWTWRRGRWEPAVWRSSRSPPPPHGCWRWRRPYHPPAFGIQVFWTPPSQLYVW